MDFAPSIRISPDIASDLLNQIKSFLIDDRFLSIFKNHPAILRNIVALLVLEMLNCFEVYGVTEVLLFSENRNDSR